MMKLNPFHSSPNIFHKLSLLLGLVALTGCQPTDPKSAEKASVKKASEESSAQASPEIKRVAIFQYANSPIHREGVAGILEGLKAQGFVDGSNLKLSFYSADRNPDSAATLARQIVEGDFDLVVTTGTQALEAVHHVNQDGSTAHVFGLVASPSKAGVGLDAGDRPGHLAGVGSAPPVAPVFQTAGFLYPGLKRVGVVWNPAESNSQDGVEKARRICQVLGFELLEAKAATRDEVTAAAKELLAQGAQALWIGPDNTAHHAADDIVAVAREGKIPVLSSMPGDAERGALIDYTHHWQDVGVSVGELASQILAGTDPGKMPIEVHSSDRLRLTLNKAALEGLEPPWSLPPDIVEQADKVIE